MNSLYGRFGMNPNMETHSIIDSKDLESYLDKYEEISYKVLENSNDKILISYKNPTNLENDNSSINNKSASAKNVSIVISSAITSYARIFMGFFKFLKKTVKDLKKHILILLIKTRPILRTLRTHKVLHISLRMI
jgi:hypothetical protein